MGIEKSIENQPGNGVAEGWDSVSESNPYAELYPAEMEMIIPGSSGLDRVAAALAFPREKQLICKRAEWWLEHKEEGTNDSEQNARLKILQEIISKISLTDEMTEQKVLFNAGKIYGLINRFNDIYTDNEINSIGKVIEEYGVKGLECSADVLAIEATAGKNLGGEAYLFAYPQSTMRGALREKFKKSGFTHQRAVAWLKNIENGDDEELEALERHHAEAPDKNSWGLSDFITECLIQDITPRGICELIQINKRVPSSETSKFEQNRVDALALDGVVYPYHAFIHNQHPGVHELISAMVDYYDTKDDETTHRVATERLQNILAERQSSPYRRSYQNFEKYIFNLENYEKECEATDVAWKGANNPEAKTTSGHAIDILRRIEENTRPGEVIIPETKDEKLNELLKNAEIYSSNEAEFADLDAVGDLVENINDYLVSRQGQNGLSPSQMRAIIYAERAATVAMRGISQKDWRELFYDHSFKEIVKFRELTGNYDGFSEEGFEQFWNRFSDITMDADDQEIMEKYRGLAKHITEQLSKLAHHYKELGREDFIGDLWSGNLAHELVGLVDKPTARNLREVVDEHLSSIGAY